MQPLIEIDRLSYTFNLSQTDDDTLDEISLNIMDGEFVALTGPKGCGKSTLLSLIAGLLEPDKGNIYINGEDIISSGKNIGYMMGKEHLSEWRNTKKSFLSGLEIQKQLIDDSEILVNKTLNNYGMIAFKNLSPKKLSGGMKQRVALIRTLLSESDILLLDEPFKGLDSQSRSEGLGEIYDLIKRENKTVVLSTNDMSEAVNRADSIIILSERPGRINRILKVN